MARWQPSTLARYLFVAYVLLVVYASLHPFSGWRDRGLPPFAFLTAPLPRPIPVFDVVANIIGYMPLGFLAVLAVYPWLRRSYALGFGLACSVLLSFALESLQLYLPTRVSSNLDLLANTVGGAAGALAALATTRPLMDAEGLQRLRNRLFLPGRRTDLGLVLLGLWLFAQLSPETLLFGTGDLRDLFKTPSGKLYPAEVFLRVEAGVACANGLAAGLLALYLTARNQPARAGVVIFLAAALAVFGFADVPFVYLSIWFFRTQHPQPVIGGGGKPVMRACRGSQRRSMAKKSWSINASQKLATARPATVTMRRA